MKSVDLNRILDNVREILGAREGNYSDCRPMFDSIAGAWSWYLGVTVTRKQAAYMMILFKIARIKSGKWTPDNGLDVIGYSVLAHVIETLGDSEWDGETIVSKVKDSFVQSTEELAKDNIVWQDMMKRVESEGDKALEKIRKKQHWDHDRPGVIPTQQDYDWMDDERDRYEQYKSECWRDACTAMSFEEWKKLEDEDSLENPEDFRYEDR